MQRNWIGRSPGRPGHLPRRSPADGRRRTASRSSPPAPTRCSARPSWCWRPSTRWWTSSCRDGGWPEGTRAWSGPAARATPAEAVAAYRQAASRKSDVERQTEGKDKTGVFTGVAARRTRSTATQIPVFVADYVLMGYGTGAIMAVPGQDERDWEFADEVRPADRPHGAADRRVTRTTRRSPATAPAINSSQRRDARSTACDVADAKARIIDVARGQGPRRGHDQLQAARLAVQPPALLGRAVPDRLRRGRDRPRRARTRCCRSSCPRCPTTRPKTFDPDDAEQLARAAAVAGARVGRGRARPGRRAAARDVPPRDQHDAQLGRVVLVLPALPRPGQPRRVRRPGERGVLDGPRTRIPVEGAPAGDARPGRRRPLRRRRRARRAAPALRPLLAQGAVRPRPRVAARSRSGSTSRQGYIQAYAYPDAAASTSPADGGRGAPGPPRRGADLHLAGPAGQPRVRQDRQVAEERRSAPTRCTTPTAPTPSASTRCRWARWS